jgi:uncharacterized cupredoxin-like copper-binding protein
MKPPNGSLPEVERELHELEDANDVLDQRTGNLEMRGTFGTVFVFFSLAVSLAALTVALVSAGGNKTVTVLQAAKAAPAAAAPATKAAPVTAGVVSVKLGEMFVRPNVTQGAAGKVTFHVQNTGTLVHEMIVGRVPIKGPLADGRMSEKTSVGEVAELKPGTAGRVTLSLKPGKYILFCNVPGHFAAGQHVAFTVTKA